MHRPTLLHPIVIALLVAVLSTPAAHCTWGIIIVDLVTREVAVGTATCVPNDDLRRFVPLIRVDRGGACAQSFVDGTARNRKIIWRELRRGTAPADILTIIQNSDSAWELRQFGIVDLLGRAATHTGTSNGAWAGGLTGTAGNLTYAIQGNVLVDATVIGEAEKAIQNTQGDVAEKLMAAATTTMNLRLVDWQGVPLASGGATISLSHRGNSAGLSTIGAVVDHGDGTYTIPLTAGVGQGHDRFKLVVDDGIGPVRPSPIENLRHGKTLLADVDSISSATGGTVHFSLLGPEDPLGKGYLLLASNSGTSPGLPIGPIVLPLNPDIVMEYSFWHQNGPVFTNTQGQLGSDGRATAHFNVGPGLLAPLVGGTLSFASMTWNPTDFPSSPLNITIDP